MGWFFNEFQSFIDYLVKLLSHFTELGPIGGIMLAMIEAFFPPLPLTLFVTINVLAFGFLFGYLYSLAGTIVGSICMFFIIRKLGRRYIQKRIEKAQGSKICLDGFMTKDSCRFLFF